MFSINKISLMSLAYILLISFSLHGMQSLTKAKELLDKIYTKVGGNEQTMLTELDKDKNYSDLIKNNALQLKTDINTSIQTSIKDENNKHSFTNIPGLVVEMGTSSETKMNRYSKDPVSMQKAANKNLGYVASKWTSNALWYLSGGLLFTSLCTIPYTERLVQHMPGIMSIIKNPTTYLMLSAIPSYLLSCVVGTKARRTDNLIKDTAILKVVEAVEKTTPENK